VFSFFSEINKYRKVFRPTRGRQPPPQKKKKKPKQNRNKFDILVLLPEKHKKEEFDNLTFSMLNV
jgi:hypothetical protein